MGPGVFKIILAGIIGAGLGYALYKTIGCSTGSCPLTSNPWISTLYGAVMGILFTYKG